MKKLLSIVLALGLLSLSSCIIDVDDDFVGPPCEYNFTGTVCFVNYTGRDLELRTAGLSIDIWAYTDQCIELGDGYYEFIAKSGFERWEGSFDAFVCEKSNVYLDY